jgi:hypothetical protein
VRNRREGGEEGKRRLEESREKRGESGERREWGRGCERSGARRAMREERRERIVERCEREEEG